MPEADALLFERNPVPVAAWRTIDLSHCTRKGGACLLDCDVITQGEQHGKKSFIRLEYRTAEATRVLQAAAGSGGARQHTEEIITSKGTKLEFKLDLHYAGAPGDALEFGFVDFLGYLEKEKMRSECAM